MTRKIVLTTCLFIIFVLGFSPYTALAAPGDLDLDFGTTGIVITDVFSGNSDRAKAVAIQADGKIVAAGDSFNGNDYDFALVRYNTDGSLDTNFGTNGIVTTDFLGSSDYAEAMAIQEDGKIVVAGLRFNGLNDDFVLVRYKIDGSLDNSFDNDGVLTTDISGNTDYAKAVAIQSDEKIVVAGVIDNGTNFDFTLVRYNPDGSLDTDFGTNGIVTTDISGNTDQATTMAIQEDGKIVVAGRIHNGTNDDIALVRYNTDGSLDTSFDTDGMVTTNIGNGNDEALAVAIQADGKIVAAGDSFNGIDSDFALVRYNTDGSLDTSFDTDGIVTTHNEFNTAMASALAIQADGKIVAAGNMFFDFALLRYNTDGSLDTGFGTAGIVVLDIPIVEVALAIQTDGKIVAASYNIGRPSSGFVLMRFVAQGFASLNVAIQGAGTGFVTSDPVGIDCSGDCSEDFNADTIVTLTAAADAESTFLGWAGSCTGANVTCQVTMDQARNVIAWFDLDSGSTGVCFITSFFD